MNTAMFEGISRRAVLVAPWALSIGSLFPTFAHAQELAAPRLLVRGEAELSGGEMAWRVVRDVAEAGDEAQFERRALGFAVNSGIFSDLLLTDRETGSGYRLAPGEAAFVREGTMQRRESLGEGPDSYLRIALVAAANANDAGGDRLEFAGPGFSVPAGLTTLTLQRIALDDGEMSDVIPGAGQALVLVEQGEIEIQMEQGEAAPRERMRTVVGSDTNYAIRSLVGGTTLVGMGDGTSVLVAMMG